MSTQNAFLRAPVSSPLAAGARSEPDEHGTVQIGEFRGDRLLSVLVGLHPVTKKPYRWVNPSSPIEFEFKSIKWHPDIDLPWLKQNAGHTNGEHPEPTSIGIAARWVTIDLLWKHFGFAPRVDNPTDSPFRDDNTPDHPSFSVWFDKETGKQIFRDHNAAYADHKGDSFDFFKRASGLEGREAGRAFLDLAETIQRGETPQAHTQEREIHIPPMARVATIAPIAPLPTLGSLASG